MNDHKRLKTVGILGGMGPEATAYFFELIIKNTPADRDQDHVPVIIWSNPLVPCRKEALLEGGPSPLPLLIEGARKLQEAGADFIVMPCITAHYFHKRIASKIRIPFLNLIDETRRHIIKSVPGLRTIGLIATTGTVKTRIVHDNFARSGIQVIIPDGEEQAKITEAVYGKRGIKAGLSSGRPRRLVLSVSRSLLRRGAEAIMAGCTEIPLVLREGDLPRSLINPMKIGALASIKRAGTR